jgi:hypothetical protein
MLDFAERLVGKNGPLKDSPALQQFVRDLSRSFNAESKHGLGLTEKTGELTEKLPSLSRSLGLDRVGNGWKERNWLPSLPNVRWSGRPPSWEGPRGMSLPNVGRPDVGGADTWSSLLWLVTVVVVGGAVLSVLLWQRTRAARAAEAAWKLGPWPVNPATVSTREDLVRAFEYLSLLLLGRVALTWNHLEIAARLGGARASAERLRAAAQLAALYEQARYAPPHEALPGSELAAARRDLCLLAGVPAA